MSPLPNFLIIGAGKAGTTSLYRYLDQHPEISMSSVKEPHFFAPAEGDYPPHGRISSRDAYEALFDFDTPLRGEASPSYSVYPYRQGVPEKIRSMLPNPKFIYMVRDPIERIRSFYVQRSGMWREPPFRKALGNLDDPANWYLCGSRYMLQIERYAAAFSSLNMLVVDQQELLANRAGTLRAVFAFLGADPTFSSEEFGQVHNRGSEKTAYWSMYQVLQRSRLNSLTGRVSPAARRHAVTAARRFLRRPLELPDVPPDLRAALEQRFGDEVERLREFTGQDFRGWSL